MAIVYEVARSLGSVHLFSQSLQNVTMRAVLVNHLDSNVIANTLLWACIHTGQTVLYLDNLPTFLNKTAIESYSYISEVSNVKDRVNIPLRLWVGCIEAAKMIRFTSVIESKEYSFGKVICERIHTTEDRRNEALHIYSLA